MSRKVSIKKNGPLVESISLDILMDKTGDSRAHAESIKKLLKLTGIADEFDLGDPG